MKEKLLGRAIKIASEEFEKKIDKSGEPYILHCLTVMNSVKHLGEDAMICAVLHDIIEDTDYNGFALMQKGFTEEQVHIIKLLTHEEGSSYDTYIKAIATHELAIAIKLADLKHNSDITRLKGLSKKDFDRIEKYFRSFTYLNRT